MKKLVIGFVSACTLLGSASALASPESCQQIANSMGKGDFPQKIDKHTVQKAYKIEYNSKSEKCEIVVNYDFHIQKFVDQVVEMAPSLERNPERVARFYVTSDRGAKAVRQMIEEEYGPKYEGLKSDEITIKMNARFNGFDEEKDEEVENQYFELHK